MKPSTSILAAILAAAVAAQVQPAGVTRPIVEHCGSNGGVVCVNKYVRFQQRMSLVNTDIR